MAKKKNIQITINRAPVLTLWAAIVAERLGYKRDEAATLGKTVAGLNAASKAQHLGLAKPHKKDHGKKPAAGEPLVIELLGRHVKAVETDDGVRALHDGKPVKPESVHKYLEGKFGEDLDAARDALKALAKSRKPKQLAQEAYALYEVFRPEIPRGKRGWGAKGVLDLDRVRELEEEV